MSGVSRLIKAAINKDGAPSLDEVQKAFSPDAVKKELEEMKKENKGKN